jgi:hypothetical protein
VPDNSGSGLAQAGRYFSALDQFDPGLEPIRLKKLFNHVADLLFGTLKLKNYLESTAKCNSYRAQQFNSVDDPLSTVLKVKSCA